MKEHSAGPAGPIESRLNQTHPTTPIGGDVAGGAIFATTEPVSLSPFTRNVSGIHAEAHTVPSGDPRTMNHPPLPGLDIPGLGHVATTPDAVLMPVVDETPATGFGQMVLFGGETAAPAAEPAISEDVATSHYEPTYKESFGKRFRKSLKSKAMWTGINMAAGAPVLLAENYLNNAHITHAAAVGSYAALMATLVAVGERIVHKQMNDGHSPSWGAPLGHALAARMTDIKDRMAKITYAGYSGEVVAEEVLYALPAVAAALSFGVNAGAGVATGGALVSIASNIAKHHSLKEHSGPPILFKKTRERLQTKRKVVELFRGVKPNSASETDLDPAA